MTREECIEILDKFAHHSRSEVIEYPRKVAIEAFEMAIAALKAEPCDNAISKQAIMDLIKTAKEHGFVHITVPYLEEIIEYLPPVILKQRWIPVDYDRYPETYPRAFQEVWMTDLYGEVNHRAYDGRRNIKAWMPYVKPEPYKEGESE